MSEAKKAIVHPPKTPSPTAINDAWNEQLAQASLQPQLLPHQWQASFARFARFYARLSALPRRLGRRLQRGPGASLAKLALLLALGYALPVQAAEILVNTDVPDINADGECSLIEAIVNANEDAATHPDCAAGSGADSIELPANSTHTLTSIYIDAGNEANGLPLIESKISIQGNDVTIVRSSEADIPEFRIFEVANSGDLSLDGMGLSGGSSKYYDGGGIANHGALALSNCEIFGNYSAFNPGGGIFNDSQGTVSLTKE